MPKQTFKYEICELSKETVPLYCVCLEDWSDEMKEAGNHKALWYEKMKDKGLRVKLAKNNKGEIGGMIQYFPAEYAGVNAPGMLFIQCTWVHGYKKGRGNFQKKGMGTALIKAAEEDAKSLGADGLIAWGLALPFWMKASWYKKRGFKIADKQNMMILLWKQFKENAQEPKLIRKQKDPLNNIQKDKVIISAFINGVCPVGGLNYEKSKKAALSFKEKVEFREINTYEPEVIKEWGITDAVYINNNLITAGPLLSYKKILKLIKKEVKKLPG